MVKNLVVYNSSAGSGKTYTLVKEFLKLALKADSPFYFRKILAITFTNKAAAEMKERVLQHLTILSATDSSDVKNKKLIEDYSKATGLDHHQLSAKAAKVHMAMLHHYADISISTIDSFVHRLVRTFSKDLGLVSDFDVETDADEILQTAVDRLLSEAGVQKEITDVLLQFINQRTEDEKGWNIDEEVFKFSRILLREDSIEPLKKLKELSLNDFNIIKTELQISLKATEKELSEICTKAIKIITDRGLAREDFQFGAGGAVNIFFKGKEGELDNITIGSRVSDVLETGTWKPSAKGNIVKEIIASVNDELLSLLQEIKKLTETKQQLYISRKNIQQSIYNLSLLAEVNRRCEELKQEKGIVLISDLNRLITAVIMDEPAPFIYERLGERYSHVLIDEFQDTSVLQWQNFIPLIENSLASGNFNMLVGDAKQSIYRWRNGEMEQLVNLPSIYGKTNLSALKKEREKIFDLNFLPEKLNINYRSKNEIVHFNNAFFKKFYENFPTPLRKVYETYFQELPENKPGGYVEIKVMPQEEKDRTRENLNLTLEKIINCTSDGYTYSDIVVLCRRKTEGALIASFLSENKIPVISGDSLLLGNSDEVNVLICFLRWYADPGNTTTAIQFIEAFAEHLSLPGQLHILIGKYSEPIGNFRTVNVYGFLKDHSVSISNDSLYSYSFYQLAEDVCAQLKLNRKDPFVSTLLDFILTFSSRGGFTLHQFLEWWDESGKTKAAGSVQEADAVKIMTIHKSKGLQFPVVVFPFVNWQIKAGNEWIWTDLRYNENKNLTTSLLKVSKDKLEKAGYGDVYEAEKEKTDIDQINLLYVAFTRAEDRLYIFSDEKNKGGYINQVFLQHIPDEMKQDHSVFYWGKAEQVNKKPELKTIQIQSEDFNMLDWKNHLRVSFESVKPGTSGSAYFGNLLHDLLSRMDTFEDRDVAILTMFKKGIISKDESGKLITATDKMFEQQFIQEIFSSKAVSGKEFEIIDSNGKIYRPDRLVFLNGKNILIDFKTGAKKNEHKEQISKYGELLEQTGITNPEKFLYYTGENEFVKV